MKYLIALEQEAACDYSPIGCGKDWFIGTFDGPPEKAADYFISKVAYPDGVPVGVDVDGTPVDANGDEVYFAWEDEGLPSRMVVVPATEIWEADIATVVTAYQTMMSDAKKKAKEEKELAEFERLSKRFGGGDA